MVEELSYRYGSNSMAILDKDLREEFETLMCQYEDKNYPLSHSAIRAIIWDKTGGKCWYCGKIMNPFRDFSIDHTIPLSAEGIDEYDNLVPCCQSCNAIKRNYSLEEFRIRLATNTLGIPSFSKEQIVFLERNGFDLTASASDPASDFAFYFERKETER